MTSRISESARFPGSICTFQDRNFEGSMPMRLLLMIALAVCAWSGLISAQESPSLVESVTANPQPDGKTYLLSVVLQNGHQLSLEVRPADAANIVAEYGCRTTARLSDPGGGRRTFPTAISGKSRRDQSKRRQDAKGRTLTGVCALRTANPV